MSVRAMFVGVALALVVSLPLTADGSSPSEALLKARIVQLETQLAEAMRRYNLLVAQLSEAQQPAVAKELRGKREQAEKLAGCVLDWSAVPPVCQPQPAGAKQ